MASAFMPSLPNASRPESPTDGNMKVPNVAAELILNDHIRKMWSSGSDTLRANKRKGLLPRGMHSTFGDFPPDMSHHAWKDMPPILKKKPGMQRCSSAPGLGTWNAAFVGTGGAPRGIPPKPPKAGAKNILPSPASNLRKFYDRGDLPIGVAHGGDRKMISWKVHPSKLDLAMYLPLLFDGAREQEDPYRVLAVQGAYELVAESSPESLVAVLPSLIVPMKTALNTRQEVIMCTMMKLLQHLLLVGGDSVGEALVPYYRQLLPIMNIFKDKHINIGDQIHYGQRYRTNMGELVADTLNMLERHGGEDAFINIKYMIPTYESCVQV